MEAALASLPGEHAKNIKNIAIVWLDKPTKDQRVQLELRNDQTLLGLYEGLPLSSRQGITRLLPDKITLFKGPIEGSVEIGHYYGLNHDRIRELE